MPHKDINHCQTFYQYIGKSSKTILLLHGWRNNWQTWGNLIPWLSRQYAVLAPDLPGFGQSESPAQGWTTNDYLQWLQAFLAELEITELEAVIGHSYGGKLAGFGWLGQSLPLPPVRKGLFLIDPSGIPNSLSWPQRVVRTGLQVLPRGVKRGALGRLRARYYRLFDPDADYLQATPFQEATLRSILREDVRSAVSQPVHVPLHLCWGEKDTAMPAWMAYEWQALSHHSDVFVVPEAGHFPHHDAPELSRIWLETWLGATS